MHTTNTAGTVVHQDLRYTYDPVGNITEIRDLAQPIVFTSNAAISADQRFVYDALYRLIEAEGREHGSQGQPIADDFTSRAAPDDPTGLRAYVESYAYDLVGNILHLQHQAAGGSWTRRYDYAAAGNRLLATSAPGDAPGVFSHAYQYNAHGSMTAMPHLAAIDWDHADRMQSADLGGGGTVWFLYDSAGNRVRKIRVNQSGTSTNERIYLGGYEVYRERVGTELRLERETLHIADDSGRICLVETKTIDDGDPVTTPANIARYQYGNHLGSVGMELDETGQLISYEEFHPYGTTAYRAANSAVDVSPSRYRYTGQERDEETGLGHHGARYYASWLGRWTAADPIGLGDGVNRFAYARGRPTTLHDSTGTTSQPQYIDFSDDPELVTGDRPAARVGVGYKPPAALSTEGDPAFERFSLAVDRPSIQRQQALRDAEVLRGQIQLGKARPPGLPSDATAIEQAGIVVGFVGDKLGTGGDVRQVYSIAGDPVGEFARGIDQDFTIELAVLDVLAAKGLLGMGRAAFVAALERRAVHSAIRRETGRFAAEGAAGLAEGSTPAAFADALVEAEARVAASRAEAGSAATLEASATNEGGKIPLPTMKDSRFGPKIADQIPDNGVPSNWSKNQIEDAIVDYETSIVSRNSELAAFDASGSGSAKQRLAHTRRITKEEAFLRSLRKAMGNRR